MFGDLVDLCLLSLLKIVHFACGLEFVSAMSENMHDYENNCAFRRKMLLEFLSGTCVTDGLGLFRLPRQLFLTYSKGFVDRMDNRLWVESSVAVLPGFFSG